MPRNILLVEGADDEHVVKHLCSHHGLPEIDEIKSLGGIGSVIESFPVRLKESDVSVLGVLVDADTDLNGRWQSLRTHLERARYQRVPAMPSTDGTIIGPPPATLLPRVGIWVMPDNQTNGILEDFLRFLIPIPSPLFGYVQQCVNGIPTDQRRFSASTMSKALIHTWLSWQREPGKPLGVAITARYLDAGAPYADSFIAWLRRLYFSQ